MYYYTMVDLPIQYRIYIFIIIVIIIIFNIILLIIVIVDHRPWCNMEPIFMAECFACSGLNTETF